MCNTRCLVCEKIGLQHTTIQSLVAEDQHLNNSSDCGLTDLLAEFYQFHLCWHVPHCPHALAQILAADKAVFVFVELPEGLTQLCSGECLGNRVHLCQ